MAELYKDRQYKILTVFMVVGIILAGRAFHLQVIDDTFSVQAEAVAMSRQTIYPSRGLILDRNRKILINNTPVYDLKVIYNQLSPNMDTLKFCRLLGIDRASFEERLNKDFKSKRYRKHLPFVFMSKISPEMYARFQESLYEFPGFFVQVRNIRSYPFRYAAHVLGYIREVTEEEIDAGDEYALGDYIGASGLERAYESELRGEKGCEYVLKDNLGRDVGRFEKGERDTLPESGLDLLSSLDVELQQYAEALMNHKIGGIVAIEPSTGEILAFASSPSYDPGLMVIGQDRGKAFMEIQQDPNDPMFNRAIMAEYPPGSIFKTVIGLVGMQNGVINPYTGISCPGYYVNSSSDIRKCRGHPYPSNVGIALQWSCNTYFFTTFRNIVDQYSYYEPNRGLDTLASYLDKFGLGRKLGVDFPGEHDGNIPTSAYYNRLYPKEKGSWRSPTIVSLGIGQGEIQLTTLQMANLAAVIANKGYYYIPHFAKGFMKGNEWIAPPAKYQQKQVVPIKKSFFDIVVEGMGKVVSAGTASSAAIYDIPVAGKTGTVQNPHGEDHSTFIGFAPQHDPKIAIAVYVENAGGGGRFAAPIASLIMEKYIRGEISPERQWKEQQILETKLIDEDIP